MVLNDFELAFAGLVTYGNRLYGSKARFIIDKGSYGRLVVNGPIYLVV